jgi:hypothetical protein
MQYAHNHENRAASAADVGTASRRVLEKIGFRYERLESADGVDEEWF